MELNWPKVAAALCGRAEAADEPGPAYAYDLEALRRHASGLAASLPAGFELFYAVKANSDAPLLRALAPAVAGFEVASGGELAHVRDTLPGARVAFGGPGKTDAELAAALDEGVELIHAESQWELKRLAWLARSRGRRADVLLRVNLALDGVATTLVMGGRATPFGVEAAQVPACLDWLAGRPELRLRGFHFHLASHQLDARAHLGLVQACLDAARRWRGDFRLDTDQLNVGGGVGVNYREPGAQFDWSAFAAGLGRLDGTHGQTVRFELGRFVAAFCGVYAAPVLDLKSAFGRRFVVVHGGTHHFRLPYAQGHSHPFRVLPVERWVRPLPRPEVRDEAVTVVGQLCTPKDVLADEARIERVRVGDLLAFPLAGAYAWHISHHDFLRHPHPAMLYLP